MYSLIAPASGANNIVVSSSSSITVYMANTSYTGVKQTGQPEQSNTGGFSNPVTSLTTSVTTTSDNCWLVGYLRAGGNQTAQSGTTLRTGINTTLQIADSN